MRSRKPPDTINDKCVILIPSGNEKLSPCKTMNKQRYATYAIPMQFYATCPNANPKSCTRKKRITIQPPRKYKVQCFTRPNSSKKCQNWAYDSFPLPPFLNSLPKLRLTIIPPVLSIQQLLPAIPKSPLRLKSPQSNSLQSRKLVLCNSLPEFRPHPRRVKLATRFATPIRCVPG